MTDPATGGKGGEPASRLLGEVQALAAELNPERAALRPATLDSALDRDLGLDSLGRMELLARVERAFDLALPETAFAAAETPRDLLRAVLETGGRRASAATEGTVEAAVLEVGTGEAAPRSAATLVDVLRWHAGRHPDRFHLGLYADDGEGEALTYGALLAGAEKVAAGLARFDLAPGEAVGIMLPTGTDYFLAFFGTLLAGGVPVPMYPPPRPTQIEDHVRRHVGILGNCLARVLVTMPEIIPLGRLLQAQVEPLRGLTTVADLVADATATAAVVTPAPTDIALLQYTSGSTGAPKGVILSHANLLANVRAMGEALAAGPDDVCVSWLPLYHDMGLIGAWLGSLYYGARLVVMPPLAFIARPWRWLRAIHRYRATISGGPNFAYELCLKLEKRDLGGLDLSSWRVAFNGAEPVSPDTVEVFCTRFAPYGFRRQAMMPVYGLAECAVGLAFPPLDRGPVVDSVQRPTLQRTGRAEPAAAGEADALRLVACGRPLPEHEFRIVDGAGRELPERREGHIQFRGPSATAGYFRNPEATRRLFDGSWLDTGDLGYIAGGDLHISGRAKDMVIRAGRNIYPAEVEEAVGRLPGVHKGNVVVFGSPDPRSGTERLVVLAETRRRDPAALEDLKGRVGTAVTDLLGEPPDEVVLAPPASVLRTSSGKVRRAATRDLYERGVLGPRRRAVWLQMARLAAAAVLPAVRRAGRQAAALLFAGWGWAATALATPILLLSNLTAPGIEARWWVAGAILRGLAAATGIRIAIRGIENLPAAGQPCVVVANHMSYLDGFVMVAVLPRPFVFVAKAELAANPIVRLALGRLGVEFVERAEKGRSVIDARRLAERVQAGCSLFFFAEGTFVRTPGLLPFRLGAFEAAVAAEVPVVPVAIRGTRNVLRSESWFPRRGAVTVTVEPPIAPPASVERWAAALRLRDAARAAVLRHCGEPDRGTERAPI